MPSLWIVAILLGLSATMADAADLTVIEAVWTTNVSNRQYGPKVEPDSQARSIYFWTRLSGGKVALEELQKKGRLPIRHVWSFSNVFTSESQDLDPAQEKTIEVGEITDQGGLKDLVNRTGRFTWRTWSHKDAVWGGRWTVSVQYANGEPVICDGNPCKWSINLQE